MQPESALQPPRDTGEAYDLSPASLTVTLGLGPAVFGERFGLARFKPALFSDLPDRQRSALTAGLGHVLDRLRPLVGQG